jgi:RNA-directed DNA polymerase
MSLTTPGKIRELQIKLYRKAKNEPGFRFYQLYDKVYREDILNHAYALARANDGAPGVDGQSFQDIESEGLAGWMNGLREDLRNKTYQPQPVRRAMIEKRGGGERPLGIPTIRDRVVQTAAKLVLEPIWEAELEPSAYGYRPRRSRHESVETERGQDQGERGRPAGTGQRGSMGRSLREAESEVKRLARILRLWGNQAGVSGGGRLCL